MFVFTRAFRPTFFTYFSPAASVGLRGQAVSRGLRLLDLGLTSQDLVSLAGQLRDATGEALLPSVLFDYPTIERLAAHLADTCPAAFGAAETAELTETAETAEPAELTATAEPAEPAEPAETGRAAAGDAASGPAPGVIALLERLEGGGLSLEETIYLIENTK
ncbi:hypothetical protein DIJ62_35940 [Burkholderia pseudomallei]|nr:hypothetical protein DIJ62_35940 [Burkholderia pseudomallei]